MRGGLLPGCVSIIGTGRLPLGRWRAELLSDPGRQLRDEPSVVGMVGVVERMGGIVGNGVEVGVVHNEEMVAGPKKGRQRENSAKG